MCWGCCAKGTTDAGMPGCWRNKCNAQALILPCFVNDRHGSMSSRHQLKHRSFVVEIKGRAVLALAAGSLTEALRLCSDDWFVEELSTYRSGGEPIWDGSAKLDIRQASAREATELEIALSTERARTEYDGFIFAFMVPLDATP